MEKVGEIFIVYVEIVFAAFMFITEIVANQW